MNKESEVRRAIMDALMKLMTEKNYMEISVMDIVNASGVSRASFYRRFGSIPAVIDAIVDELSENLCLVYPSLPDSGTAPSKWREFLVNHFRGFITHSHGISPKNLRLENLSLIMGKLDEKSASSAPPATPSTLSEKYSFAAKTGLINSVTSKWLDSGARETTAEMVDYIMTFITKF